MADPYSQALAIGAPFANLGKQMFQGQAMYEQGRSKSAMQEAQRAAYEGHASLYGAQAQKAQEEAAGLAQRRQYQTPEFATKLAANLAGLSEGQGAELSGYQQRGNWGMNPGTDLPAGQEGPPMPDMPKSAPSWYNPQIEQRVNQARGVALGNLAGTGNSKIDDMTKAFVSLLERGDMDAAMAGGNNGLNAYQAAMKGKMYDSTPRGILNQDGGKEAVNADWQKVQRAAAAENFAQANNANASAAQHIASRDLTRSKIGQPTVNQDGSVTAPTGKSIKLSATAEKELFEADDNIKAGNSTVGLLKQALDLNDKAYNGYFAKGRATLRSNLPGDSAAADATINLDNMMTTQALESLKTTFGAAPTEGERKILLDIQASADKTPTQRKEIINRAIKASEQRLIFNTNKAKSLRSGTYNSVDPQQPPQQDGGIDALLKKYGG